MAGRTGARRGNTNDPSGDQQRASMGGSQPGRRPDAGAQPPVKPTGRDEVALDAEGIAKEPVGSDTISLSQR